EGVAAALDPDVAAVVTGGREVAAALAKTPLDLLLFTGSPQTGALAREAAASAGSPLVLELGGKSPAIIGDGADLDRAAAAIVAGKLINAGQTCVAPDYLLTPRSRLDETIRALREQAAKLYPTPRDLTALASPQAVERIARLAAGQSTIDLLPCPVEPPLVPPRLVIEPALGSAIMREEIFGPLLPVVGYETIDDAIAIVNGRPDPLALYWFGPTGAAFEALTARTRSGSIAIDDTVIQAGVHEIAFGGIGASGVGRYHGKAGFDTFTHERPVFRQARFNLPSMLRPPFGKLADRILGGLIR
ncbi:MAG: aldehyde dehydrogenase family protein, partial [Beijerinckiaceae bacterium]|nr:aldehyde dehydrogenase family protein [Beijerinckiaceae bacterium]